MYSQIELPYHIPNEIEQLKKKIGRKKGQLARKKKEPRYIKTIGF